MIIASIQVYLNRLRRINGISSIFSFPIPLLLGIAPQKIANPFSGVSLKASSVQRFCLAHLGHEFFVRSDFIFDAVPDSLPQLCNNFEYWPSGWNIYSNQFCSMSRNA